MKRSNFFSKTDQGLTKSLNKLIKKAKGELIARQDADDISNPERIQKQVNYISANKLDACTTRSTLINSNTKRPGLSYYIPNKVLIKIKNPFIHGTLMIKKNVLYELGLYDQNFYYAQDYKLFTDLIKSGYRIKTINETLYMLNIHNTISTEHLDKQNYFADCVRSGKSPELNL